MEKKIPKHMRLACLWTLVFSLLAHAYRYLSLSFSGDAMLLSQAGEAAYQVSLGRFLQPVYWQIRGTITAPLLIGLFATAFLMFSACLMTELLSLRRPLHIALACGVLATCETMAISNATYLPWTDVYMLAMALGVLGVYVFFRSSWGWLISPVLFCLSLGLYQSYLPVAATLMILVLLLRTLRGERAMQILKNGLLACLSLLLGLLLYALVLRIILSVMDVNASQDYNGVGRVALPPLEQIPALLRDTFTAPLRFFFSLSDTPVMTWHIPLTPKWLNILLFALALLLLAVRARALAPASRLMLLFLLCMLPLGMNFVQFISGGIANGLTIYAYQLAYLLPIMLMAQPGGAGQSCLPRLCGLARRACVFLLALLIGLNIINAHQMYVKRDLEFSSTTSAVSRLLDRAEQTQDYIPGETPVVLIGMLPSSALSMERPGFEDVARVQGMRYTYAASYETSTYWYLQMALGQPINLVSHEERIALSDSEAAKSLAAFPQEGCCRMIDGCLYLRIN